MSLFVSSCLAYFTIGQPGDQTIPWTGFQTYLHRARSCAVWSSLPGSPQWSSSVRRLAYRIAFEIVILCAWHSLIVLCTYSATGLSFGIDESAHRSASSVIRFVIGNCSGPATVSHICSCSQCPTDFEPIVDRYQRCFPGNYSALLKHHERSGRSFLGRGILFAWRL